MRFTDVFLTFRTLVLALFLIGILGTGLTNVIIAIALCHALGVVCSRIVRQDHPLAAPPGISAGGTSGAEPVMCGFFSGICFRPISQLIVLATPDIGHMMLHVSETVIPRWAWRHPRQQSGRDDQ